MPCRVSGAPPVRCARWQAAHPDNHMGDQGRYAVITSYFQSYLDDFFSYGRQRFVCEVRCRTDSRVHASALHDMGVNLAFRAALRFALLASL